MRTVLAALALVVVTFSASGSESVQVEKALVSVVASEQQLREACAGEGKYDACTRFVAFRMNATCAGTAGSGWRVTGTATFRPFIILRNLRSLSHEHEHIDDLRRSVELLMVQLEAEPFAFEEGCRARVALETGSFGATMRRFAQESNHARHSSLR